MSPELTATLARIEAECHEIIALGEKATKGPWRHCSVHGGWDGVDSDDHGAIAALVYNCTDNATFIAHSRQFSPAAARALLRSIGVMQREMNVSQCAVTRMAMEDELTAIAGAFGEVP